MSDSENICTCKAVLAHNPKSDNPAQQILAVQKCPLCQQTPALKAENERLRAVIQTMLDALESIAIGTDCKWVAEKARAATGKNQPKGIK